MKAYRFWLPIFPLLFLVFWAFYPVLGNGFVDWDDPYNFFENPHFNCQGLMRFLWSWTTFWFGVYQPLGWLFFEGQAILWGLNPWGYHLTSLIFHLGTVVTLYFLTAAVLIRYCPEQFQKNPWTLYVSSALAACFFGVHPLRTEVVAWVSGQSYIPCTLFFLLGMLAYLRACAPGSRHPKVWLTLALLAYTAAVLCKAPALTFPLILLILDLFVPGRWTMGKQCWPQFRQLLLEKIPFFVVLGLFSILTIVARWNWLVPSAEDGISSRLGYSFFSPFFYLGKTILPWGICHFYPWEIGLWNWIPLLAAGLGFGAVTALVWRGRRQFPGVAAAWFAYLILLGPNLGIVRLGTHAFADRYSYLAMCPLIILAAGGMALLWQKTRRPEGKGVMIFAGLGLVLILSTMSRSQCRIWQDTETLWRHDLQYAGAPSAEAHGSLGLYLIKMEKWDQACHYLERAVALQPDNPAPCVNLALAQVRLGKFSQARDHLDLALRHNPDDPQAHRLMGFCLARQGQIATALIHLEESLRLDPSDAEACFFLGYVLGQADRLDDSTAFFRRALVLRPAYAEAFHNLGMNYLQVGQDVEASCQFLEAVRIKKDYLEAWNGLGIALVRQGKLVEAVRAFEVAIQLNTANPHSHLNLANALARQEKYAEAIEHFRETLRLDPRNVLAQNNLAMALSKLPG